jgi:hypothetical protein
VSLQQKKYLVSQGSNKNSVQVSCRKAASVAD